MHPSQRWARQLCALFALLLGISGVLVYLTQPQSRSHLIDLFKQLGLITPLMFVLAGTTMGLVELKHAATSTVRPGPVLALILIGLAAACGSQYILPIDLGIDFVRVPTAPTVDSPYPGRPAPNTCLSFLIAGFGLFVSQQKNLTLFSLRLVRGTGWAVLLIAATALVGFALDLAPLYKIAQLNMMFPTTACGLLAIGAWLVRYHAPLPRSAQPISAYRGQIHARVAAILLVVVASTAAAGFAILRGGLEQSILDNIRLTATTNATSLASTLESRLWLPKTIVTRPSTIDTFRQLLANSQDATARQALLAIGDSVLTAGLHAVRFETPEGKVLAASGTSFAAHPVAMIALRVPGQRARLLWQDGFLLSVENDVRHEGVVLGKVVTEERLPNFEKLVRDVQGSTSSSDLLICGREGNFAVCAPSRIYADSKRIPMFDRYGKPNLPINRALLNETGTLRVLDLRKVPVLAAYGPIGDYGLGMVVKIDEDTVYAPMRQRFADLGVAVLLIIVLGAAAVRIQVQPVLSRLVSEQSRTRVILENSNDAFIALDAKGLVQDWNPQAVTLFGWSEQEAQGRELSDLIIPEPARAAHRAGLARFAASGQGPVVNKTIEVTALRRDGTTFPVELSVTGYRDGDSYVSNAFLRDISERKAAQQRIADSERFLRTVTDHIPAFVAYVDAEERYRFANAMYRIKRGLDPAGMIGKTIAEVLGSATYAQLKQHIDEALAGRDAHFELAVRHPGSGEPTHLMVDYIPELAADGTVAGFHILAMDISVRKNAELRQAESERKADQASRAKSEFVANMSHEIRTPMNAVLGLTHLLRATPLTADQRKYLDMVRKSGSSLLSLLNDVLDFSKIEAGQMEIAPERFLLADVLASIATIMTVNARDKDIDLAIGVEPDVPPALIGDRLRLEQVLTNIVGNAIKFTEQGEVSLLVEKLAQHDGDVELQFVIRDTGIGMTEEHLSKIFSAFSQGDSSMTRRFGGTGLGLAISRKLVRMMGGDITTESQAGVGSVFRVAVRMTADGPEQASPHAFARPLRVLVIDDNPTSRNYLCKTVTLWGWTACSAASGPEALQHIAEAAADKRFDVVLADFDMPGLDGITTTRALASAVPDANTPVVILITAFQRATLEGASPPDGAHALLLKPVTGSSLFDTLHEVLTEEGSARPTPLRHQAPQQWLRLDGARILLAEDNELNQIVAKGILEASGARVEIVGDGQQALERLRSGPGGFDLILMDVQMPVMDGFTAARLVRDELGLTLPIIAMTAGVMSEERQSCFAAGMVDFIAKPVEVDQMLETIARHWKKGHTPSASSSSAVPEGVFNVAGLLAMSETNPAQRTNLVRLIAAVVEKSPGDLRKARAFWKSLEVDLAARTLHSLRGAVGSLGAKRFAATSLALERALQSNDPQALQLFEQAERELAATMKAASDWLHSTTAQAR